MNECSFRQLLASHLAAGSPDIGVWSCLYARISTALTASLPASLIVCMLLRTCCLQCSVYVSDDPTTEIVATAPAPSFMKRRLQQTSGSQADYFFDPLIGTVTSAPAAAPAAAPLSSSAGLATGGAPCKAVCLCSLE